MSRKKENLKIGLVELPATLNGHLALGEDPNLKKIYEDVFEKTTVSEKMADDIYSLLKLPPRAIPQLTSILKNSGFLSTFSVCPEFNAQKGYLTREEFDNLVSSDIVGISAITRTIPQSYELAMILKKVNPDIIIIFGGPHSSALPEESLNYGDIVVRNEGDITILELMEFLLKNRMHPDLQKILGISYKLRDSIFHNEDRPFLTIEQLSNLPFPVYSEEILNNLTNMVIATSRGCPYNCEFCSVIKLFGSKYRFPDEDYTLNLIKYHVSMKKNVRSIFFSDDNLAGNVKRTKRILKRVIEEKIPISNWSCQVRVEAAFDEELLSLMRMAGCDYVCVGFESINLDTLKAYNKKSTPEKNFEAIKRFQDHGLMVHGMFVLGSDHDTVKTVNDTFIFARKARLTTAQFFSLVPLPGTPDTLRREANRQIISKNWHLYDGFHVLVMPEKMTVSEFQNALLKGYKSFYNYREAFRFLLTGKETLKHRLYNTSIRLMGRKLTKSIYTDSLKYLESLNKFQEWKKDLDYKVKNWKDYFINVIQNSEISISEKKKAVTITLGSGLSTISKSYSHLGKEYIPYCKQTVENIYNQLQEEINKFQEWKKDLDYKVKNWKAYFISIIQNNEISISEKKKVIASALESGLATISKSYSHLGKEYIPYCKQTVENIYNQLQEEINKFQGGVLIPLKEN
jgi:radical SAM superfamily enzyme YgiQ (UPF0313 family)